MNNFLLLHTSLKKAFVAIAQDDRVCAVIYNDFPKEHGSFLHAAVFDILAKQGLDGEQLAAIGVTGGPGSYTGIRVGLSAAKGLGYAWGKPLIVCSNLMALAATAFDRLQKRKAVYIPLIHARQSEYYTGYYDENATMIRPDSLQTLDRDSFSSFAQGEKIIFGVGLEGLEEVIGLQPLTDIADIAAGSFARIVSNNFFYKNMTDAENAVPVYLKDVYIKKGPHKLPF